MRAAFIHGIRDLRLGEWPSPAAAPGEVPIRVAGVGVCGSDIHYYLEGGIGAAQIRAPFVPGHEFAGWVEQDRPELGLARGQLVAVDPARPCGRCEWCHRGHVNLCPNVEFLGAPPHHGALTERIAVRPDQIFPVPDGFSVSEAVMLEPLGVAVHAMDLARPRLLESVAILGCGTIGLCLLQLARLAGVGQIIAIDPVGYRTEVARRLGAQDVAASHTAIDALTAGRGADLVLEATNSPLGFQHAAESVAIGGRVVLVGIPEGDSYTFAATLARRKGLTVRFSRRMGHVYPRAIRLVAERKVDMAALVTHRVTLDRAAEMFGLQADYRDGVIKSVIHPNGLPNTEPKEVPATPG